MTPPAGTAVSDTGRPDVVVSISVRTLLVAAGSSRSRGRSRRSGASLLVIFVSVFSVAVLSPVATAMERRLGWSRGLCATVLVLGIVIAIAAVLLVLAQAISGAVRDFSDDLPEIVDQARHSDLGNFINGGSGSLDTLQRACERHHRGRGQGVRRRRPCRGVGLRRRHAVFSVVFLTLFGLIDEPRVRDWVGGLLYRDNRERYLRRRRIESSTRRRATCSATWRSR